MATFGGPRFPGIANDGLVFAIDPLNKESWTGPDSAVVNNIPPLSSTISGSIYNDTSGSLGISGSFIFDGTDDYIDCSNPTNLQITGALTISAWVKFTGNDMALVTKANTSGTERSYGIWVDRFGGGGGGNTPVFFIWSSGTTYETPGTGARADDGNWHHLVGVFNPSTSLQLYIDGNLEQENTTSIPATIDNDNVDFNIGRAANGLYYYNGNIGPVLIYNRALTALEVSQNYNQLKPRFT
tara:strand:- start:449 stop:1171 length:723 start_codon:yes stop_codon:yes gene_type:complete